MGACAPWATEADLCAPCSGLQGLDEDRVDLMLQIASDVLYQLTRRKYPGACTDTVRPCARWTSRTARWAAGLPGQLSPARGGWGWCGCNRERQCGCSTLSEIRLPGYPVTEITEVLLDGEVLDPAGYRLDDRRYLVRLPDTDGEPQGWPCCQRMDLDTSEPGTFAVTYEYGAAPPPGGVLAAASLACEYLLGCDPDTSVQCRLPRGTTSVNRLGLSITVIDPEAVIKLGATGLPEVDLWVAADLLGDARRRATAFRTGGGRTVRRTT